MLNPSERAFGGIFWIITTCSEFFQMPASGFRRILCYNKKVPPEERQLIPFIGGIMHKASQCSGYEISDFNQFIKAFS